MSKYEKGRELPRLSVLGRMLTALNLSFLDFAEILTFVDSLGSEQHLAMQKAVRSSASTLLGPSVQSALRKVLEDVVSLQSEVLTTFLLHAIDKKSLDRAKNNPPTPMEGESE